MRSQHQLQVTAATAAAPAAIPTRTPVLALCPCTACTACTAATGHQPQASPPSQCNFIRCAPAQTDIGHARVLRSWQDDAEVVHDQPAVALLRVRLRLVVTPSLKPKPKPDGSSDSGQVTRTASARRSSGCTVVTSQCPSIGKPASLSTGIASPKARRSTRYLRPRLLPRPAASVT